MIDGVPVNDAFGGVSAVSNLEVEAVQDLEVITGTFNAEYGNAMSGIVNAVTKDGATSSMVVLTLGSHLHHRKQKKRRRGFHRSRPIWNKFNSDLKFSLSDQ